MFLFTLILLLEYIKKWVDLTLFETTKKEREKNSPTVGCLIQTCASAMPIIAKIWGVRVKQKIFGGLKTY